MKVNGKNIKVYTKVNNEKHCIAACKDCTFSHTHSLVETIPSSNWRFRTYTEGKQEWEVSVSGLVQVFDLTADQTDPLALQLEMNKVYHLSFDYPPFKSIEGDAYLTKISISASKGKMATYSCSFKGSGPFQIVRYGAFATQYQETFD